jgi:Divergent InlB B-repeat domain/IPTL-CTERM motif
MPDFCRPSSQELSLRRLWRAANLLFVTVFGALAATSANAATAVFQLQDQTNLTGSYQIYVTGFSTAGPYVLQADGSWGTPATPSPPGATTTLPCYRFPQDITQVQINSLQTAISARVYYFVVTDTARFPTCNPASGTGLFNQQGVTNAFTYTLPSLNLTAPTVTSVAATNFPAWTFSEIGASATTGTIDLSQVDFFAFPMNTTATVTSNTPANPTVIGNPIGATDNPGDAVNALSIRDSYSTFINGLAEAKNGNQLCSTDPTPVECAYLDLLQNVKTTGSAVPQYVIQNPGGFLGQNTATTQTSRLNTVFDNLIGNLWTLSSPPTLTIDTGGVLGATSVTPGVPEDLFTSSIVTMNFPGSAYSVKAMKFTGTVAGSGSYVAYVFSPKDYQTGCATANIPSQYCSNPPSTGYQVFAGAGALGAPLADTYNQLLLAGVLSPNAATYGSSGYNAVVARLGFLISGAMNRGVALVPCTGQNTWKCWQDETYWYPVSTSSTFPDITQNLFSRWMHTSTIGGTPMFKRPPSAVRSASSTAGSGKLMGMAYGFSNDENPTPQATTPPQPEAPSKMDQTVVFGGSGPYTITFGPWVTQSTSPTLSVTTQGAGTVTSSPAGINCGPACSQSYASGTTVILTASPSPGWIFSGWSGACAGGSTTCSVTLSTTTIVNATFTATAASTYGLNVVLSGAGTVTSVPPGISCGSTCSAAFNANTSVTLSAAAGGGSTFAGWSGACSGQNTTCTITMSAAQNVGATFVNSAQFTLTVTGGSNGIVTTVPGGIDCGTSCVAGFAAGAAVSVIARPNPGYQFIGWSGACSGTNTCDLTMNGNKAVQATFAAVPAVQYALTVHDFGAGTVVSSPSGINCGVACSAIYLAGTEVTLSATPSAGYRFTGWAGACTGAGACVVSMDDLQFVDATFTPNASPGTASPIPTLAQWALMLMSLLLVAAAYWQRRVRPN